MIPVVTALAERVVAARRAGGQGPGRGPIVVAIDGRSGAGKSTLAAALVDAVSIIGTTDGGADATTVSAVTLEELYRGWTGLAAGTRLWSHDVLPPLADGRPATYAPWDWRAGRAGPPVTLGPAPVVIAEGVGAGVRLARPLLDILVWLSAPSAVRRQRALARDGYVFAPWWEAWAGQEEALLAADPIPRRADVVVDVSSPDGARWHVAETAVVAQDDPP